MVHRKTNIMSFNVRYNNPADGKNAWPFRREKVAETVRFHNVDIVGFQEVLWNQIKDMETLLPEYDWFGVGRDDGKKQGEFAPVFYRKDRIRALKNSTFWLSQVPDQPGIKGWDAACTRIVTWGYFQDIITGNSFYLFNTHFDHIGEKAKIESARLILKKVREIAGDASIVLTGDFNSTENDSTYIILTRNSGDYPPFTDTYKAPEVHRYGGTQTFTGFQEELRPDLRIDYIFVQNVKQVFCSGILYDRWDGTFISDHNPVAAQILIQ
ncbi:endonuclease/exonuclease/phosphatase family protein [bacterium]